MLPLYDWYRSDWYRPHCHLNSSFLNPMRHPAAIAISHLSFPLHVRYITATLCYPHSCTKLNSCRYPMCPGGGTIGLIFLVYHLYHISIMVKVAARRITCSPHECCSRRAFRVLTVFGLASSSSSVSLSSVSLCTL